MGRGCYNLDCGAFVQSSSKIKIGLSLKVVSQKSGLQVDYVFGYRFDFEREAWDLFFNGDFLGHYPGRLFGDGPMATGAADAIDFGGETSGKTYKPEMGSGEFAVEGYGQAAYQRNLMFYNYNQSALATAAPVAKQPSPKCYTAQTIFNNSQIHDGRIWNE